MARFTASVPLDLEYAGHFVKGPAGTTFRIADSLRPDFESRFGHLGLTWIEPDEIAAVDGGEATHPDLAAHVQIGLASASHSHSYEASGAVAAHVASSDPHVAYALDADLVNHQAGSVLQHATSSIAGLDTALSGKAASVHAHAQSDVTGLTTALAGKAASIHTHAESQITGLVSDLAGKAASIHSHATTDLPSSLATDTEVSAAISQHEATATHGAGGGQAFPVGSVFISVVSTNPGTLLGYGTWAAFGAGRVMVGFDSADVAFDAPEEVGGAKTHTHADHTGVINHQHTVSVTDPGHSHLTQRYPTTTGSSSGFTSDTSMSGTAADNTLPVKTATTGITASTANPAGGVAALTHDSPSHLPPYIVAYFWKRTA